MKVKKLVTGVLAAVSAAAMSVSVMAAGSITGSVDTNNVTAQTAPQDTETIEKNELVGDIEVELETVGASLTKDVKNLYEEEVQKIVDALNSADAETTVKDAFIQIFGEENLPKITLHKLDGSQEEDIDLGKYKFISPVMDLKIEKEPTEENPIEVTFTVNNMTDNIQVDVLHFCEGHNWEVLEGKKVSDNQVKASFHSASPIALIYKELPEEETEVATEEVAP
ncbi:hypothetical protein [Blautia sp.]|uniref:DUF5105 domain-containing protein n=1 Tax=Blautia glucerasea TaxID=536633 RepID=A0A6N2SW74_9FIRM